VIYLDNLWAVTVPSVDCLSQLNYTNLISTQRWVVCRKVDQSSTQNVKFHLDREIKRILESQH
jgi:hypothetical protein